MALVGRAPWAFLGAATEVAVRPITDHSSNRLKAAVLRRVAKS